MDDGLEPAFLTLDVNNTTKEAQLLHSLIVQQQLLLRRYENRYIVDIVLTDLVKKVYLNKSRHILPYIFQVGFFTELELEHKLLEYDKVSRMTPNRLIRDLIECKIVKPVGYVENQFLPRKRGKYHRKPTIYGLIGADPSLTLECQKRYKILIDKLLKKHQVPILEEKRLVQAEKMKEEQEIMINEYTEKVMEKLDPNLPPDRFGPIYSAMNELGIKGDLRKKVFENVINIRENLSRMHAIFRKDSE